MLIRLEKINPGRRQRRFYVLYVTQTLFGEWCVIHEWGRIGSKGGQRRVDYLETEGAARAVCEEWKAVKLRSGYAPIPVQLTLFG
ncbi:WGR domain-containing protein [Shimia sp. R10_1]|uniref:WGR domain-containing protein n=1 Tax=Shimia sp. R10_1 TaxID=2821095 RepID=UPI001ADA1067|nr:WGR domain-containing protein [Shimia sp. R10_1]